MQKDSCIRPVTPDDLPALKTVIDANQLFPSDLLDEMISDYFNNEDSNDYWFTYDEDKPVAIASDDKAFCRLILIRITKMCQINYSVKYAVKIKASFFKFLTTKQSHLSFTTV